MPIYNSADEMMAARLAKMQAAQQPPPKKKMKPSKRVRSAAQVAMSKTNPAEPEERYVEIFKQLDGAIGSVCVNCRHAEEDHFDGFCNPEDATQIAAQRELEESQRMTATAAVDVTPESHWPNAKTFKIDGFPGEEFDPVDTSRIEIVEQALDLLQILPDCPERDMLARQCAVMVSNKMSAVGYSVREVQP